jgi:hypothetical protein
LAQAMLLFGVLLVQDRLAEGRKSTLQTLFNQIIYILGYSRCRCQTGGLDSDQVYKTGEILIAFLPDNEVSEPPPGF